MEKENLQSLSITELEKKKKTIGVVSAILIGMLLTLLGLDILLIIKKGFSGLSVALCTVPFTLLPILIIMFSQKAAIEKELKSRAN